MNWFGIDFQPNQLSCFRMAAIQSFAGVGGRGTDITPTITRVNLRVLSSNFDGGYILSTTGSVQNFSAIGCSSPKWQLFKVWWGCAEGTRCSYSRNATRSVPVPGTY